MATTHTPLQLRHEPAPGTYTLDPVHSEVSFTARHLMVSKVHGRFPVLSGTLTIGDDPLASSVEAVIDVAGVHSGDARRDEHLRSADFFDADRYPTATFRSTEVTANGDGTYTVTGALTIREVTKPVQLRVEYLGTVASPWGDERAGLSAAAEVNRKDWGLEWNLALEAGGVVVGDRVKLAIEAEAIRQ